ncbi:MAG: HAMP domain-containing histidine kinase [Actinomycetia bacterium]|nr:HAMP domain-containing histidine kinase [Actinomycetes bacterium]
MRRLIASTLSVLAIAGALVLMLVFVSIQATEQGSTEVGKAGQVAIMAEETLSAVSAVRNATTQALILEDGRVGGLYDMSVVSEAVDSLNGITSEFQLRANRLVSRLDDAEQDAVTRSSAAFIEESRKTIAALSEPADGATSRVQSVPPAAYDAIVVDLLDIRDSRIGEVAIAAESVVQVTDAVRFLVVVVIPIGAMLLFRRVFRRRREREQLHAELDHQMQMNAQKDEFVTNLSHELRTPLTGIYGFALALDESGFEDPNMASELTGHIITEAGELSRMVDDLITAGQIETGKVAFEVTDIDIDPIITRIVEPYIRSGVDITVSSSGFSAEADAKRFEQIMRTLLSNAAHHGGSNIDVFAEHGAGMVSVFVMDDGPGVPDEIIENLFERYMHEGDEPLLQGSVGLGLAIARSLTVGMGGSLSYTRTNGLTYFVCKLPSHMVAKLHERVVESDRAVEDGMYDTQQVAKLFAR